MQRVGDYIFHPVEWKGVTLMKPSLSKPRTVDPLIYGVGNLRPYKRPKELRESINLEIQAVCQSVRDLEVHMANAKPTLNLENYRDVAKSAFLEFGKSWKDELNFEEFKDCLIFLDYHFTDAKSYSLYRVGDLDDSGLIDFGEFKFVMLMLSQLPRFEMVNLWEIFTYFSQQNKGY